MQGTDAAKARDTRGGDLSRTVLGGGALITLLLSGLVYLLSTSRSRALRAVEVATSQLRQANERFRFAFEQAHTGMAVIDVQPERLGRFIQVNDALCDMFGRRSEDLTGRTLLDLTHPDERARDRESLESFRDGRQRTIRLEKRYVHASGRIIWTLINATLIDTENGRPAYAVAQVEDVTAQRAERQRLAGMALHDPLTGLGNRLLFQDHITQAVARTARSKSPLGLIYCDLDRFKEINDNYGHAAGDLVLQTVGHRLQHGVRPADTIARIGGDEFVVLCEDLTDPDAIQHVVTRIREALREPILLHNDVPVSVGCSIGVATAAGPDLDITTLLHQADLAMYRNKHPSPAEVE